MPRSFGLFLILLALLPAREVFHGLVTRQVELAITTQRELGPLENAIVSADYWVLLWYPFGVIPVLLAPLVAIVAWAIQAKRSIQVPVAGGVARGHLRVWAMILAGALGLFAAMVPLWNTRWSTTVLLSALFAFSWATAGGLFAALWLQRHRNESGAPGIKAASLAAVAFLLAILVPFTSAIVALWVLWASRDDITPNAQHAG